VEVTYLCLIATSALLFQYFTWFWRGFYACDNLLNTAYSYDVFLAACVRYVSFDKTNVKKPTLRFLWKPTGNLAMHYDVINVTGHGARERPTIALVKTVKNINRW